jgi:hypothetical protein
MNRRSKRIITSWRGGRGRGESAVRGDVLAHEKEKATPGGVGFLACARGGLSLSDFPHHAGFSTAADDGVLVEQPGTGEKQGREEQLKDKEMHCFSKKEGYSFPNTQ